eukprot:10105019-Lingulodinium_polyedra.AAC.1
MRDATRGVNTACATSGVQLLRTLAHIVAPTMLMDATSCFMPMVSTLLALPTRRLALPMGIR